jgi:hypothetical protein
MQATGLYVVKMRTVFNSGQSLVKETEEDDEASGFMIAKSSMII